MKPNPRLLISTLAFMLLFSISCEEETPLPVLEEDQQRFSLQAFDEPISKNLSVNWDDYNEVLIQANDHENVQWLEYKTTMHGYMTLEDSIYSNNIFFTLVERKTKDRPSDFILLKFVPANGYENVEDVGYFNLGEFSGTIYGFDQYAALSYVLGITEGRVGSVANAQTENGESSARVQKAPPLPSSCPEPRDPACQNWGDGGGYWKTISVALWKDWFLVVSTPSGTYGEYIGSEISGYETRSVWVSDPYSGPSQPVHEHYSAGSGSLYAKFPPHPDAFLKSKAEMWEEEICENASFATNECVQTIWDEMKELNVGYETLTKFLGDDPIATLCMDIIDLGISANGNTDPGVLTDGNITINLNSRKLTRSKLSIARTVLHEMIHAELFSMIVAAGGYDELEDFAKNASEEDDPFRIIWDYFQTHGSYITEQNPGWQHEKMADHYIEYIADGLKKLHPSLSSNGFINFIDNNGGFYLSGGDEWIPWNWDDFFVALAWEGLSSSSDPESKYKITAWEELSKREKALIKQYQANGKLESNKCN